MVEAVSKMNGTGEATAVGDGTFEPEWVEAVREMVEAVSKMNGTGKAGVFWEVDVDEWDVMMAQLGCKGPTSEEWPVKLCKRS